MCVFSASGSLSVARNGGGGGLHRRLMGEVGWWGGSSAGAIVEGSTVEGSSNSKNQRSHLTYKYPKKFVLKQR